MNDITLRDIAPFTQVFFHLQTKTIIQIDWDGLSLKKQNISMYSPFLICSNSLYDQKTQTELKTHFINQNSTKADEDVSSSFHKRNLFLQKSSHLFEERLRYTNSEYHKNCKEYKWVYFGI